MNNPSQADERYSVLLLVFLTGFDLQGDKNWLQELEQALQWEEDGWGQRNLPAERTTQNFLKPNPPETYHSLHKPSTQKRFSDQTKS